ncbi:MAG: peptide deformylase, partial [Firmicutes bacterium]|nr:peptide deformylase [Bacillota bacterium]
VEYEGTDLLARAFCHETDHLNGVLFIDKAEIINEGDDIEYDEEDEEDEE